MASAAAARTELEGVVDRAAAQQRRDEARSERVAGAHGIDRLGWAGGDVAQDGVGERNRATASTLQYDDLGAEPARAAQCARLVDLTEQQLRVGDDVFTVRLEDGRMSTGVGAGDDPDLDASMDMSTFFGLASRELEPRQTVRADRVRIDGKPETLERCFRVLSITPRLPAAA